MSRSTKVISTCLPENYLGAQGTFKVSILRNAERFAKNWKFGRPPKGSGARARSARYTRRARSACTPKVALHRARAARLLQKFGRARAARLLPEVRERASHTSTLAQFTDGGARCAAQKRGARSASAPPQATGREKARQYSHWQPAAQLPKLMCGRIATTSARTPQ